MELTVDQDLCISCGLCVENCPDVFKWNEEGLAEVLEEIITPDKSECSLEALEDCPVEAIKKIDNHGL